MGSGSNAVPDDFDSSIDMRRSSPTAEGSVHWEGADLGIDWPLAGKPLLSADDGEVAIFRNMEVFD